MSVAVKIEERPVLKGANMEPDASLTALMDGQSNPFVSIEFFPPKTEAGVPQLYKCLENLGKVAPLFADVTWGAGGSTSGK